MRVLIVIALIVAPLAYAASVTPNGVYAKQNHRVEATPLSQKLFHETSTQP